MLGHVGGAWGSVWRGAAAALAHQRAMEARVTRAATDSGGEGLHDAVTGTRRTEVGAGAHDGGARTVHDAVHGARGWRRVTTKACVGAGVL